MSLDRLSSLFWFLIGLYVSLHAYNLGLGKLREPGPGFIFFLGGGLLSILSAISLLLAFLAKPEENNRLRILWSGLKWQKIVIVLISLCAWMYFFTVLGFFLATFILLIFLFEIVEPVKWWVAILSASIAISVSYAVFKLWLNVPFPVGFLGI